MQRRARSGILRDEMAYRLKARPFEPFVMQLSSGETVRVDHPDAAVPGTDAVLVIDKRNGRLRGSSHESLFHVVRIEPALGSGDGRSRATRTRRG